jgi:hypothetical protein
MSTPEPTRLYAVTKVSPVSGVQHVLQLLLTPSQWEEIQPWINPALPKPKGRYLQDILPYHTPEEREFVLSGTVKSEWDMLWGENPP